MADAQTGTVIEPASDVYVAAEKSELIKVGVLGAIAGIAVPAVGMLLATYFITPVFCNSTESFSVCASGGIVAYHVAGVLVGIAAVIVLIQMAIFRGVLLALAATIAMWGFKEYVDPLTSGNWLEYFAFSAVLSALSYVAFYWLLRIRTFGLSLGVTVVAAGLMCWALAA